VRDEEPARGRGLERSDLQPSWRGASTRLGAGRQRSCAPLRSARSPAPRHLRPRRPRRGSTPRPNTGIAGDVAPLTRTRAGLEPERTVHPKGTDRSHVRAAVVVHGGQPRRAGVRRVRSRSRPRIELFDDDGSIHRRQPVRLSQIDDLHFLNVLPVLPASACSTATSPTSWPTDRIVRESPRKDSRSGRCLPTNWQRADRC
jgi:hypothetical protein